MLWPEAERRPAHRSRFLRRLRAAGLLPVDLVSATHGDDLRPSHHPERYDDNPTALTRCAGVPEAW